MNSRLFLLYICFLIHSFNLLSQDTTVTIIKKYETGEKKTFLNHFGLIPSVDLTYTGYNAVLSLEYENNKFAFYAGPKLSLTNSYVPGEATWGGNIGYRYLFLSEQHRWRFFINADYQLSMYNSYKEFGVTGSQKNYIHEINLSYGVRFQISRKLFIGNSIGMGKYFESFYSYKARDRKTYQGYDALLRLFLKYRF